MDVLSALNVGNNMGQKIKIKYKFKFIKVLNFRTIYLRECMINVDN